MQHHRRAFGWAAICTAVGRQRRACRLTQPASLQQGAQRPHRPVHRCASVKCHPRAPTQRGGGCAAVHRSPQAAQHTDQTTQAALVGGEGGDQLLQKAVPADGDAHVEVGADHGVEAVGVHRQELDSVLQRQAAQQQRRQQPPRGRSRRCSGRRHPTPTPPCDGTRARSPPPRRTAPAAAYVAPRPRGRRRPWPRLLRRRPRWCPSARCRPLPLRSRACSLLLLSLATFAKRSFGCVA